MHVWSFTISSSPFGFNIVRTNHGQNTNARQYQNCKWPWCPSRYFVAVFHLPIVWFGYAWTVKSVCPCGQNAELLTSMSTNGITSFFSENMTDFNTSNYWNSSERYILQATERTPDSGEVHSNIDLSHYLIRILCTDPTKRLHPGISKW